MDLALVVWVVGVCVCVCVLVGNKICFGDCSHTRTTHGGDVHRKLVGWLVADCSGKPETHA